MKDDKLVLDKFAALPKQLQQQAIDLGRYPCSELPCFSILAVPLNILPFQFLEPIGQKLSNWPCYYFRGFSVNSTHRKNPFCG